MRTWIAVAALTLCAGVVEAQDAKDAAKGSLEAAAMKAATAKFQSGAGADAKSVPGTRIVWRKMLPTQFYEMTAVAHKTCSSLLTPQNVSVCYSEAGKSIGGDARAVQEACDVFASYHARAACYEGVKGRWSDIRPYDEARKTILAMCSTIWPLEQESTCFEVAFTAAAGGFSSIPKHCYPLPSAEDRVVCYEKAVATPSDGGTPWSDAVPKK